MSLKKIIFLLSALLLLFPFTSFAQTQAQGVFSSVSGKVTVSKGGHSRKVKKNSTVKEGDTIATGKKSSATLRLFDGSELAIEADSKFTIRKMAKKSEDKIFNFSLAVGKLLATVKKLATSKSSFEIEAGGVVCGVRGTKYEVDYDPNLNKVDLFVTDGNVWAQTGGETFEYGAGGSGHFNDGKPAGDQGNNPPHGGKDKDKDKEAHDNSNQGDKDSHDNPEKGGKDGHGNDFNPFYGMGGNQPDPLKPLTEHDDDHAGVVGRSGDDNLLGLGAHGVILELKYPELP